jgi:hypothetical protein
MFAGRAFTVICWVVTQPVGSI